MKNLIALLVALFVAFIAYFFICNQQKAPSPEDTNLLSSHAPRQDPTTSSTTVEDDRDSEYQDSRRLKKERKASRTKPDTITLVVNGETIIFPAISKFRIVTLYNKPVWLANFVGGFSSMDFSNPETFKSAVSIMLPKDAAATLYNEEAEDFIFEYYGSRPGIRFSQRQGSEFSITVSEWGGPGGRAKGTFQGTLRAEGYDTPITVENGSFDIGIQ